MCETRLADFPDFADSTESGCEKKSRANFLKAVEMVLRSLESYFNFTILIYTTH